MRASFDAISELQLLTALIRSPLRPAHLLQTLSRAFRLGANQNNFLVTVLIGRLRRPDLCIRLLRLLPQPNILPFNASIRVVSDSSPSVSFALFLSLKRLSLSPNDFTFSELLRACSLSRNTLHVFQLHAQVTKSRYRSDPFVCNALLSAYVCGVGHLPVARKLFDEISEQRNAHSWSCMIAGYARIGDAEEAISLFIYMLRQNFIPGDDTMVSVLSACSILETWKVNNWVTVVEEYRKLDSAVTVLIYLYGKLGRVEECRNLFEKMRLRGGIVSIVAWNAVIAAHAQNGEPVEALNIFRSLLNCSSPKPNHVTIVSILSACAIVGDLNLGRWAHEYLRRGVLETNKIVGTAFIDMYSKCGSLNEAKQVFDRIAAKDAISFNAMIMGLAMNGEESAALRLFADMENLNVEPNDGTFLGLLCACAHSGMVEEARLIFKKMWEKYSTSPKLEHYACFVNLLARAGFVEEALGVVKAMPMEPNGLVWGSLLAACLVHFKLDVAREVSQRFFDVESENSAGYVMLSNALAVDQNWEGIGEVRSLMKLRGMRKQPGCSWISIDGTLYEFHAGCFSSYSQMEIVHSLLNCLLGEMRSSYAV